MEIMHSNKSLQMKSARPLMDLTYNYLIQEKKNNRWIVSLK